VGETFGAVSGINVVSEASLVTYGGWVLGDVGQLVLDVIGALGYLGLALLLIAENLFPPIPSEVVLPLAGFLVGRGDLNLWGAIFAATFGSVAGALILYALGRWGGRKLVLRYGKWLRVDEKGLRQAEGWFRGYGDWVVLGARVVPVARSIVSIPAGTAKMPLPRFVILTTLGSATWNSALIGAGVALGANWQVVERWVGSYSSVVLIAAAVLVALLLVYRHLRGRT
jgi:membrane protein DedA with SNARE-associated domain